MALRAQQMAKEIPQDVLLSLFSPPRYIWEHVCAQSSKVSWGDPSVKAFWVSVLGTLSHCPFSQQERSRQGRAPERESGSTCLFMGLPITCEVPLDRQLCSCLFPCHAHSFISILHPQGGDSSSVWLRSLETACTMLVLLTAASVSQEALETLHSMAFSAFHRAEHKAAHEMEMCQWRGKYGQGETTENLQPSLCIRSWINAGDKSFWHRALWTGTTAPSSLGHGLSPVWDHSAFTPYFYYNVSL